MTKKKATKRRTVKKKTSSKKRTTKKKVTKKKAVVKDVTPSYMVQIGDPKAVRRDMLESLRDVIIFMQGHEKFLKLQEEKAALIVQLKEDIKEIHHLVEYKLKRRLPKGKVKPVGRKALAKIAEDARKKEMKEAAKEMSTAPQGAPVPAPLMRMPPMRPRVLEQTTDIPAAPPGPAPVAAPPKPTLKKDDSLEELETQLQDIENQLRDM